MKELKLNNSADFNGWFSREAVLTVKADGEKESYPVIVTTEAPALVVDWERWEIVREVLLMDGMIMPENRQVPLLDTHSRFSISDIKGSVRNLSTESEKALGDAHFWSGATEEKSKVKEGHLTDVSAGYKTFKEHTIELKPFEKKEINGKVFENNYEDRKPFLIRTKWAIKEVSLVPIGADSAAKFRSHIDASDPDLQKLLEPINRQLTDLKEENNQLKIKINERKNSMEEPVKTADQIAKEERERIQGIDDIAGALVSQRLYKAGKEELIKAAARAKSEGTSVEAFRQHIWGNLKQEDIVQTPVTDLDMPARDYKKLSIKRALDAMVEVRGGNLSAWDKYGAGLEKEAINEANKRAESIPGLKVRGMALPMDFFKNPDVMRHSNVMKRAYQNHIKDFGERSVGVSAAANIIATELWANEFIDVLRNLGVAGPWGVRMISGAKGNPTVPKKTSTGTFHWVAESGTGTATDFVIGQLTATPHNGWASMKYTRQASLQSIPALDALIIDDILNNVITGRDLALLHGTGLNNQPTGISETSGIGSVVGANLDWDAIVEFWTDVKTNNINSSNLRFVCNALTAGKLMTRPVVSGGYLGMLWDRLGQISAPPIISEQAAANNLIYGDGSESWMIDWGVIDLLVNPYKDDTGDVTITAFTAMDVLVARASAYSLADDVS